MSLACIPVSGALGGTVTSVSSMNSYISVANGNSTPQLTLNVGTSAGTVAAGNDSRFTDSRAPTGSAGGDLGGSYPNPAVLKLQGVAVSNTTPVTDQFLKYDGTQWLAAAIGMNDVTNLNSTLDTYHTISAFNTAVGSANCAAHETPYWSSVSGKFLCQTIALSASQLPTVPVSKGGTGVTSLTASRLLASDGTGAAVTTFTCAVGQLMTFDSGGVMGCTNYSASNIFANGGNSFSGAATLGTNDAYALNFETGGTTKMTILTGGNIGIGTTNPAATLEVVGGIKLGSMTACTASQEGSQRYNSTLKIMEFCDGIAWQSFTGSSSIPTGAVMAFDLTSCPSGWTEYTAARGRFLRGIDNGAGNDPSGTRAPGSVQVDDFKSHTHSPNGYFVSGTSGADGDLDGSTQVTGYDKSTITGVLSSTGGAETRPKNVAVLFCRKN
ncbi:hypothetical protein [Bdellovibrio sp. BCCA]|uniref:hypothetical protein n=1 Tax=Bdellovibrio sp. BCCA TaxID=3136281 RepID=UPI0030F22EA0